jgi:prepilin peptidase CpaA
MRIEQYLDVFLLLLVSIAAVNDLATRRIPNRLLLAGLAGAFCLHLLSSDPLSSLLDALGGMGVGLAVFLPFYLLRGMAAGDVKMMVVVGAFVGPAHAFEVAVLSWCAGGVMALLLVCLNGRLRQVLSNMKGILRSIWMSGAGLALPAAQPSIGAMPYGLAIALGTIAVLARH